MEQLAIVARLRPGTEPEAAKLIAKGPPFDPAGSGFHRHTVYLSAGEVVFVFEAPAVEWNVDDLVENPFQPVVSAAFDEWRPIVDGEPRISRRAYHWERGGVVAPAEGAGDE